MTHEPCGISGCTKCLQRENETLKAHLTEIDKYLEYRESLRQAWDYQTIDMKGLMKIREEQKK
jgi:hypothetical protein